MVPCFHADTLVNSLALGMQHVLSQIFISCSDVTGSDTQGHIVIRISLIDSTIDFGSRRQAVQRGQGGAGGRDATHRALSDASFLQDLAARRGLAAAVQSHPQVLLQARLR